jgi:hypothetical protein
VPVTTIAFGGEAFAGGAGGLVDCAEADLDTRVSAAAVANSAI